MQFPKTSLFRPKYCLLCQYMSVFSICKGTKITFKVKRLSIKFKFNIEAQANIINQQCSGSLVTKSGRINKHVYDFSTQFFFFFPSSKAIILILV